MRGASAGNLSGVSGGVNRCRGHATAGRADASLAACLLKPECYSHLIAGVLPRAARAIGPHLQGELLLLGGPEAQSQEEHRLPRQREDLGEAERTSVVEQRGDQRAPHALPLLVLADRERRQLGELGAVDLERHGPDDRAAPPPPPPLPPPVPLFC